MQNFRNLIVIGASAGGIPAIAEVVAGLTDQIDAAIVVVVHISRKSNSVHIASRFQRATSLKCRVASDGAEIERGHLYIATPDHQLMVKGQLLVVTQGTHENKYRPSIDVLFRSAAVNYGNRVIGIVLTGMLEDGTSGMHAIKRTGGICIVQDPKEAQFSDMPRSVLNKIEPNNIAKLDEIPVLLQQYLEKPLPPEKAIPKELKIEAEITERMMSDINTLKEIADHSDFICPDCGGGLWAVKNDPVHRYRCHTGHVYTEKLLNEMQDENIEETIWMAIRMLEEKHNMLLLMARREDGHGDTHLAASYQRRVNEITKHIGRMKSLLARLTEDLLAQQQDQQQQLDDEMYVD